tara:strand:+ start:59 stop:457 length:399 start_codon:yes stop_codon:yes gene_type:complete
MMKNIIALLTLMVAGQAIAADKVEAALAKAKSENKKVMVTLQHHLLPHKEFKSEDYKKYVNDNLIVVSVNRNKETKLFITLFKKYKVNRFPTSIVIDAEGNELMRNIGTINSNTLKQLKSLNKSKDVKKESK